MSARDTDWEGVRLHVVTGKGGTGKTTVAAALALALASGGKRVLLIEVEGRQGIAQVFDCPPLPYQERRVAVAPGTATRPGGEVFALAADPEQALLDYLAMFYNLRHAGTALTKLGVVDFEILVVDDHDVVHWGFRLMLGQLPWVERCLSARTGATTIAPGLRDVLLTGKAAEATRRREGNRHAYDAVVMDAPPTGRIGRFLNVTAEVSGLARVGPTRSHADTVQKVISSPETAVHFVTVLEEMPVQETLDGIAELAGLGDGGLQAGGIMINMVHPLVLSPDQLRTAASGSVDEDELALELKAAGLDDSRRLAAALAAELTEHARTVTGQRAQRRRLAGPGQPRSLRARSSRRSSRESSARCRTRAAPCLPPPCGSTCRGKSARPLRCRSTARPNPRVTGPSTSRPSTG